MIEIAEFLNKRTLIIGGVNSGKTRYCLRILDEFLEHGYRDIAVLDFAPNRILGIGGKMELNDLSEVFYLTSDILPPRLLGKNDREILTLAKQNEETINILFDQYKRNSRDILFVNDVTLYLHTGKLRRLLNVLSTAKTQIINAYSGGVFDGQPLSVREASMLSLLKPLCDVVIDLNVS